MRSKLRASEWVLVAFFSYIAALIPFFRDRPRLHFQPLVTLLVVLAVLFTLAWAEGTRLRPVAGVIRDWIPMLFTLVAFREMELFVPLSYNSSLEASWIQWDKVLLGGWGLRHAIESLGPVLPLYLEICYLLVYGVGSFCIIVLWIETGRRGIDRFYIVLLTGTLLAYALFPYFPSRPPRLAFPLIDPPHGSNIFRAVNLYLLRKATIHSGVFPSAHVSSAFAAAWGMLLVLPQKKRFGWGLLVYAMSVTIATVYGRYHYVADALAGFIVSLFAAAVCLWLRGRAPAGNSSGAAPTP